MSDKIEKLKAELALAEAEAAFVEKKLSGEASMEDRLELRALRQAWRENYRSPAENGAQPAAITSKAKAN